MLRIGIIVVLMIVPSYLMPVKESGDAAIFEDDIIIKAQPKPTLQPAVLNVFEDHVFLRKKRESENLPSSADKSSLYGDETHWWKSQKTSAQPIVNDKMENVYEDHFIMNRKQDQESTVAEDNIMMKAAPVSNGLSVVEDNIMMRDVNIFEDNIAMKQNDKTLNVFEDNIIMRRKREELDTGVNPTSALPIDKSVDQVNFVYEDNVMFRKRDASPQNVAASANVFEDHVMMKNQPNAQVDNEASEKASYVFEDHVIMREDPETTTRSVETQDPSARVANGASEKASYVFEDHFIMREDPETTTRSVEIQDPSAQVANGASEKASYVFEDHFIMREDPETTTRSVETQDTINAKAAVFEDNIMMRSDSQNTVDSSSKKGAIIEDEMVLRQVADDDKTKDSFVTEDHVILRTSNGNSDTEVGTSGTQAGNNQQSLIVIEDHLIRKRGAANIDAKDPILDNTQSSTGSTAVHEKNNQQSLIIIEDHLLRKREVANNDAKDSIFEDHVMLRSGTTQSSAGSAAVHDKNNQQSLIVIDDHLIR